MVRSEVYLSSLSYSVGDQERSIEETAKESKLITPVEQLKEAGFEKHRVCSPEKTGCDLAIEAVGRMRADLQKADAIVYATCLPQNANLGSPEKFSESKDVKHLMDFAASHLQAEFGLDNAHVVGVNQQACCSLLYAIRLARALICSERDFRSALCVTADRFPEGAIYEQAYNVISDGAAGCLISQESGDFRYVDGHAITNGALAQASDDETVGTFFNYLHRLISETLSRAELSLEEIDWIIPQNMNQKAWDILSSILGFDRSKVQSPSLPELGHMISGDNIVNLKRLNEGAKIKPGEKILLPMAGFGLNWQAIILEKT